MIDLKQALRILARLQDAAPPTTASRLSDVIALVQSLGETHNNGNGGGGVAPAAPHVLIDQGTPHLLTLFGQIESQVSALRAGRLGRMTTEQADALKLVLDYANSGAGFTRRMYDLERLRTATFYTTPTRFSPLDVAAEVWQRTSPYADARDHDFTILADNPLPTAYGDIERVADILAAMVDNAIRYMPFGGEVRLTINSLGEQVLFNVADSGIGLSEDDHLHVGEPFWRALHQPLVKGHPGTGLSLALARQVLTVMGGELIFSGEPGVGSTFSFTVPVYE
ncbi:MAG: HAMP domain-containing sensor histidine kinase [Chloroflexota bacterium]|nr:HAMP domain-containing sensor histidine kinase [Chloroflexota bacterium]